MSYNMKMIEEYIPKYVEIYKQQNGRKPCSWFTALNWLSDGSPASSFLTVEVNRVKEILGVS